VLVLLDVVPFVPEGEPVVAGLLTDEVAAVW